ncbi:MAG: nucleotide sugar dehydrogenase [Sulfuricaulis sp.]|uniref:UDP-glucose dehydrogenase family protein n=1 Tax=Sulfuricaulis sp. TaxID=2003553 RepID=UPI0025E46FCE|nr:nucleotide sugar dehydrogenase [Sulfuricaulis sp.]MCR4348014.1 nucleotide sugar dehydrogenase [Sulfuricaulis sp.]
MNVCVQGLWHLGSVTAGCLASVGHTVVGFDLDEDVIRGLRAGKPPIFEPGLEDMIRTSLDSGHLRFTASLEELPSDIELLWVAYDTPVDEDDVADVNFVVAQVAAVLPYLPTNSVVLVSSQMPVGSIRRMEAIADKLCPGKALSFAYSPENLRLGKALDVFLKPDRVVVGVRSERDKERIGRLLQPITGRIEWMSVESAEMTKHAINAFLATSVVFANEIASICEMVGADAKEVERGLKSENRIGPKAYLSPGGAFAGGTLARDIEFLKVVSQRHQISIPLLESVKTSNDGHKSWVRRKLKALMPSLDGVVVVVWGLTYKPGTDTLRRSLAVELCNWLLEQGARVRVHDPVVKELPTNWNGCVQRFDEALGALEGAQVLLVGAEWPEYREIPKDYVVRVSPGLVVLDPNRFLSSLGTVAALRYVAVGAPSIERLA